jgi:hypothetical protein
MPLDLRLLRSLFFSEIKPKGDRRRMATSTKKTVSEFEACKLGFSSWLFWEVAKTSPSWERRFVRRADVRLVRAKDVKMQLTVRVVPLAELNKRRRKTKQKDLITVTEAVRLTKGAFSVQRFPYWERVGCCFLEGKRLTVIRQDAIVKGGKRTKLVPQAKHYLRSEILEAWRTFKKTVRRQGIHVDEQGAIWLTSGAARRKYGVYEQALRHWRERGYLDAKQLPYRGSGRQERWCYRSRGPRSISFLIKLQRPSNGHVVIPDEKPITDAEARTAHSRGGRVTEFQGHPVVVQAYSLQAREQMKRDYREALQEDKKELRELFERLYGLISSAVARADNRADNRKKNQKRLPANDDVLGLARMINAEKKTGASKMQIALVFTEGNVKTAQTLLRGLRHYPHLLK